MPQDIDRQIAESLDATPELLPFLPELLADWTSSRPEEVLRFLEPLELPPTTRALDLGCGKGVVALALAAHQVKTGFAPWRIWLLSRADSIASIAGAMSRKPWPCGLSGTASSTRSAMSSAWVSMPKRRASSFVNTSMRQRSKLMLTTS